MQEIKYLREKLRMFEGTSASGFKGFSGATALGLQAITVQDFKVVAMNQDTLKKLSPAADPVANFLTIVNKL